MNDLSDQPEQQRIDHLERRLRKTQIITVATLVLLFAAAGTQLIRHARADTPKQAQGAAGDAVFHTITVNRINVVSRDGTPRVVISNAEDMPPPIMQGKQYKRAISPAGIIFYNAKGNERGGIALAPRNGGEQTALVFDYNHADGLALIRSQSKDHTTAGLLILNPPPEGKLAHEGAPRMQVQVVDGTSEIIMRDGNGKPRLRFSVPTDGNATIAFLDQDGKVTRQISASGVLPTKK